LRVLTRIGVALFRTKVFLITIDVFVTVTTVDMLVAIMRDIHRPQLLTIPFISLFFCAWRTVRRTVLRIIPYVVFMISTSSH
jgi:hypothetical protein